MLGTYSIDENGDTTLSDYGGNRVEGGKLVFDKVIKAQTQLDHGTSGSCRPRPHSRARREPDRLRATSRMEAASIPAAAGRAARKRVADFIGGTDPLDPARRPCCASWSAVQRPHADARRRQDRALERHDLGADRARVHARLRHHRADQLRPRRGLHDRLVRRRCRSGDARRHRAARASSCSILGSCSSCSSLAMVGSRRAQRDDRAGRLPAAAQRAQAGAADHRDRDALHPAERRPAVAPDARPRARPDRLPEGRTSPSSASTIEHSDVFAVVVTVPLLIALLWFVGPTRSTARRCARPRRTPTPRG